MDQYLVGVSRMGTSKRRRFIGALAATLVAGLLFASTAHAAVVRYEQDDPSVVYSGSWSTSVLPGHSGGSVAYTTDDPNATATFTFDGTGVDLIAAEWYNRGIAAVSLDGGPEMLVDLYAPGVPGDTGTVSYQQVVYSTGTLVNSSHTLTVRCTGSGNPSAAAPLLITIDAFDVRTVPATVSTPASSPWSMLAFAAIGLVVAAVMLRKPAKA